MKGNKSTSCSLVRGHKWSFTARLKNKVKGVVDFDSDFIIAAYSICGFMYFNALNLLRRVRPPRKEFFVVCMPRGGLNDVLCQIKRCYYYSVLHARRLIVCSDDSTIGPIQNIFSFDRVSRVEFMHADAIIEAFRDVDNVPGLDIRVLVNCDSDFGFNNTCGAFMTYDFRKSYKENVLFHCGRGGGFGFDLLCHLRLRQKFSGMLKSATRTLPTCFDAVQVRNTDLQSDYKNLLKDGRLRMGRIPLLVCSDNDWIVQHFREKLFGVRDVISLRPLRHVSSEESLPIHYDKSLAIETKSFYALLDLFALSMSRKLFVASMGANGLSGFPRLAKTLHLFPSLAKIIFNF